MIPLALGPLARAANGVIGRGGQLPWRLSSDLKLFKAVTLGKPVIMGRRTWDSLPKRPLPGRMNIVLTRDGSFEAAGALVCLRFDEAIGIAREQALEDGAAEVCVIGGAELFTLALPKAKRAYITEVQADVPGDVFWGGLEAQDFREISRQDYPAGDGDDYPFVFRVLERI